MSIWGIIGLGVLFIMAVYFFSPGGRRLLKSIWNVGDATANDASEAVNASKALSLYKAQIDNAVAGGRNASKVVDKAATQLISLDRQIKVGMEEQARLTNRIKAVLAEGDPNKTVEKYASDLSKVEEDLKANQEQKVLAEEQYKENVKMIERFKLQADKARQDVQSMGLQLETSEAEKELSQLAAGLKDKLSLGDVAEARQRVQKQIDANRGAAKAARDLSRQGFAEESDEELERKASAAAVLSRFQK